MVDIFLDQAWKRSVCLGLGLAVARALRAAWRQNSRIFMGICLGISSILKGFKRGLMGFTRFICLLLNWPLWLVNLRWVGNNTWIFWYQWDYLRSPAKNGHVKGILLGFYVDFAGMLFGCFSDFKWIKFILNGLLLGFHGFDTKIGEFQTCEHMS